MPKRSQMQTKKPGLVTISEGLAGQLYLGFFFQYLVKSAGKLQRFPVVGHIRGAACGKGPQFVSAKLTAAGLFNFQFRGQMEDGELCLFAREHPCVIVSGPDFYQ